MSLLLAIILFFVSWYFYAQGTICLDTFLIVSAICVVVYTIADACDFLLNAIDNITSDTNKDENSLNSDDNQNASNSDEEDNNLSIEELNEIISEIEE